MNSSIIVVVLSAGIAYGTPLLFAALGELLAERSGVLNLGVEGMMLMGAAIGFFVVQRSHAGTATSLLLAILAAGLAGAAMASIHAFVTISLRANQIVSGIVLTLFAGGFGLSSYLGDSLGLSGNPAHFQFNDLNVFGWGNLPIVGPLLFGQTALVYASWACVALVAVYLSRTRPGLNVKVVGDAPAAADAAGINVIRYRYVHVMIGGLLAGVGGATFSLSLTPQWVGGGLLTNGAGWIAVGLVIFGFWRPLPCLVGAYLFGTLTAIPPNLQAREIHVAPTEVFQALPYLLTVVILTVVSVAFSKRNLGGPASLGQPYVREER